MKMQQFPTLAKVFSMMVIENVRDGEKADRIIQLGLDRELNDVDQDLLADVEEELSELDERDLEYVACGDISYISDDANEVLDFIFEELM